MSERMRLPQQDNEETRSTKKKSADKEVPLNTHTGTDAVQRALESPSASTLTPDVVNHLQRTMGNQFVNGLVQRMADGAGIQRKAVVTAAYDPTEDAADQAAENAVSAIKSGEVQRQGMEEEEMLQAKRLQRQEMPEEDEELMMMRQEEDEELMMMRQEEDEELMMMRLQRQEMPEEDEELMMKRIQRSEVGLDGGAISGELESEIDSARSGGSNMDAGTAQQFGSAMGADFSDVKIHNDSKSHELNRAVQAKAFTTGNHIFLGESAPSPSTDAGMTLMAHELEHTKQQGAVPIQKKDEEK